MADPMEQDEKLEKLMHDVLRDLPWRRAPRILESRVLHEVQRRAARARWRRGFAHWPLLARSVFGVVCAALIGLTLSSNAWNVTGLQLLSDMGARPLSWVHPAMTAMGSAGALAGLIAGAIPATWLYVGIGLGGVFYVILFALGAAAYRSLYLQSFNGR